MSFYSSRPSLLSLAAVALCALLGVTSSGAWQGAAGQAASPVVSNVTTSGCLSPTSCLPPFTVTIAGSNFSAATSLVNISNTWCRPTLAQSSPSLLVCSIPYAYLPVSVGPLQLAPVSVYDLASTQWSGAVASFAIATPTPFRLLSIQGCVGSGQATNGCDLRSSVITLLGDGFLNDGQPWNVIYSTLDIWSQVYQVQPSPAPVNSLVVPLNSTLLYVVRASSAPTGNMTICLFHRSQLSNCLALSYFYAAADANTSISSSDVPPVSGVSTTSAFSITSITGCSVSYPNGTTAGCFGGTSFVLSGTGFTLFPSSTALFSFGGVTRSYCSLLNSSSYGCVLDDSAVMAVALDQWLPVVLIDTVGLRQSLPFFGVQFTEPPLVLLTALRGCAGDGVQVEGSAVPAALSTSLCTTADVLTLSGSGFVQLTSFRQWQTAAALLPSSSQASGSVVLSSNVVTIANSTNVFVSVASLFSALLRDVTSPTLTLSLCLLHANQLSTQCALVSVFTPEPIISGVQCGQRPSNSSALAVGGCQAGVSTLSVWGSNFLASTTVTIAGEACSPTSASTPTTWYCVLPAIPDLVPGQYYDVMLSTSLASTTLPAAVAFAPTPSLVSLTSQFCPPDFLPGSSVAALNCAQGSVLTLVGSFFSPLPSMAVLVSSLLPSYNAQYLSVQCEQLAMRSSYELTCQLPALDPKAATAASFFTLGSQVVVTDNATASRSNVLTVRLYGNPLSDPRLDSVQGCGSSDRATRRVSGCSVGDVITLQGANFVTSRSTLVQLFAAGDAFVCASPRVLSPSAMTCILPYTPPLAVDAVLPIRIYNMNGAASNWLVAVDFGSSGGSDPPAADTAGGSDLRFVVTLALLLPLVVLLLALLIVQHVRSRSRDGKSSAGWARQDDDKVQMADIGRSA